MLECARGVLLEAVVVCLFSIAYIVFEALPLVEECPLWHEVLFLNETSTFMCFRLLCTKSNVIVHYNEKQERPVVHISRQKDKCPFLEIQTFSLPSKLNKEMKRK